MNIGGDPALDVGVMLAKSRIIFTKTYHNSKGVCL